MSLICNSGMSLSPQRQQAERSGMGWMIMSKRELNGYYALNAQAMQLNQ
jgi:hypothetical protein